MGSFNFKKLFKPRREFAEKTKSIYLAAFSKKFNATTKPMPSFAFNYVLRGAGVFAALLLLITGTSTYAYGKNVGPTNVLYPLKRAQEDVRAYLAPAEKKSSFHLGLAEKRLQEAETLRAENVDSPQAAKLVNDMRLEVKKSFETLAPPQETLPPAPSPTPSQSVEEKPQSSGATQPKRNTNDVLPNEPTLNAQTIQVISPNGGEKIPTGPRNFAIKYYINIQNFSAKGFGIGFHLLKDGKYIGMILPPGGTIYPDPQYWGYSWAPGLYFKVPENYPLDKGFEASIRPIRAETGEGYAVRIILYKNGVEVSRDTSNATFSITTSKSTPSSKINPPVFGPPKDVITEKEITKQSPVRENVNFSTSSKKESLFSSVQPENRNQICKFVNELIKNQSSQIKKEIASDPEITQKFNANCDGIESTE